MGQTDNVAEQNKAAAGQRAQQVSSSEYDKTREVGHGFVPDCVRCVCKCDDSTVLLQQDEGN